MSLGRSGNGRGVKRTPGWDGTNPYKKQDASNTKCVSKDKTSDEILALFMDKEERKKELERVFGNLDNYNGI